MRAIVAVDNSWAIGCKGRLLASIKEDMKFFRETTMGNVVVMGRETLESFPGQSPLKNRVNIVLTRNESIKSDDKMTVCRSVEEALDTLKQYDDDKVYIIGGESVYRQFLPYCDEIFVTKIFKEYEADRYFPNLDEDAEWELKESGEVQNSGDTQYCFTVYKRVHKNNKELK